MILGKTKSNSGQFKKGHIPANKGIPRSVAWGKKISTTQLKRWDKIGRQSKEERLRYGREYMRKKRKDPNFVKKQLRKAREKHAKNPEIRLAQWKNWRVKHRPETLRKQLELKLKVFKYYSKKDSNSNSPQKVIPPHKKMVNDKSGLLFFRHNLDGLILTLHGEN